MKILVVDDVGYIRHFLQMGLAKAGHSVVTAGHGTEALDRLKNDPGIQVVLTDLIMPGMDGVELFKAAQQLDRFNDDGTLPPPAFFLMSALRASSSSPTRETAKLNDAIALGFVDVLTKPVSIDDICQRLQQLENPTAAPARKSFESADALLQRLNELMAMLRSSLDESALGDARVRLTEETNLIDLRLKQLQSAGRGS